MQAASRLVISAVVVTMLPSYVPSYVDHVVGGCALAAGVSEAVRLPEAAFYHKASRTLLVTDAVVYVARDPPAVIPAEVSRSWQAHRRQLAVSPPGQGVCVRAHAPGGGGGIGLRGRGCGRVRATGVIGPRLTLLASLQLHP